MSDVEKLALAVRDACRREVEAKAALEAAVRAQNETRLAAMNATQDRHAAEMALLEAASAGV